MDTINLYIIYSLIFRLATLFVGVFCIHVGYKLFAKGVFGPSSTNELNAEIAGSKFTLKNAAPGTFFGLFGVIIITTMLVQGMPEYKTATVNPSPFEAIQKEKSDTITSTEIEADLNDMTAIANEEENGLLSDKLVSLQGHVQTLQRELQAAKTENGQLRSRANAIAFTETNTTVRSSNSFEKTLEEATNKKNRDHFDKAINVIAADKQFQKSLKLLKECYNKEGKTTHEAATALLLNQ